MSENNIRTLQVLPSRSADLCFNVPGVLAAQNYDHQAQTGPAFLGQPVPAFDPGDDLYGHFGDTLTDPNHPQFPGDPDARLKYDSDEIRDALSDPPSAGNPAPYLFALRNETLAAVLDQAVARREGMYFQRFKHGAEIEQAMTTALPTILGNLTQLQQEATDRFDQIDQAHATSNLGVVKEIETRNSVSGDYKVTSKTRHRNTISVNGEYDNPDATELDTRVFDEQEQDPNKKHVQSHKSDRLTGFPYRFVSGAWQKVEEEFLTDAQISDTTTAGKQISTSDNPAFFHPRLDNSIAHKQLQSELAGEKLAQTVASLSAGHMDRIVADERAAMDFEVRRLQVAFAETYLTSPISGVVTALFKDVGEHVEPGEPVIRVENDAVVFLAGRIQFFGLLRIGQDVIVRAHDLYEAGTAEDFPGRVRAVRGHQADDDEWEVLIQCENPVDAQGRRKLPIYYQFDRDTTTIVVP